MRKLLGNSITIVICLIFLAKILTGCNSEKTNWPGEIRKDVLLISAENYNLTFYKNLTIARHLMFDILTTKDVEPSEISIFIDNQTPYKYYFEKVEMDELPEYVYLTYKGIDWGKLKQLSLNLKEHQNNGDMEKRLNTAKELSEYKDEFLKDFNSVKGDNPYKNLNLYRGVISFEMDKVNLTHNEVIEAITIVIGDVSREFTIGRIVLDYITDFERESSGLESLYLGAWEKTLIPNPNGDIEVNDMMFLANKDLTITDIKIINENVSVKHVTVRTEKEGVVMDRIFDKEEGLPLTAGTKIIPKVTVSDLTFKNNLLYSTTLYIVVNYEVGENSYLTSFESNYITKPNSYQLIAMKIDGLDFKPFYFDYYYNLKDGK